jgi:predicted transcriptional regulator
MIAKELISTQIIPLVPDDTIEQAMSMMSLFRVLHLPVVKDGLYLGVISEKEVTSVAPDTLIRDIALDNIYISVGEEDHIFDLLSRMAEYNYTLSPVVTEDQQYLGVVSQEDLITFFASTFSFKEPGGIIVIETKHKGYVLSEIARVVELENASIIASFITSKHESATILITLKINHLHIQDIKAALERYGYDIKATFTAESTSNDMKDRYDQLMRYLDV